MGVLPSLWMVWLSSALVVVIAVLCLVGVFAARRRRTKGALGVGCVVALLALGGAFLTGFTFHLNSSAPVSSDRLVYLIPSCVCPPDASYRADLLAVRVRDGHVQWRHPLRSAFWGRPGPFASDDQHVYVLDVSPDASRPYVVTALDARSGRQVWQVTSDIGASLVGVADGRLTLADTQNVQVLDTMTGKELLRLPMGNGVLSGTASCIPAPA